MSFPIEEPRSAFEWEIINPFLPWRNLETFFLHGTPEISQWKVRFQNMDQSLDPLLFSFYLEFDRRWDSRNEVVADNIDITIDLNGRRIATRNVPNFCFSRRNQFTLKFEGSTVAYPRLKPHHLVIKIEIFFSGQRNSEGNGLISDDEDLNSLSTDLEQLLTYSGYFDLTLVSKGPALFSPYPFPVHAFIIDERWDKFAKLMPYNAFNKNTINTNISFNVLHDILTYVYSGKVDIAWPDWTKVAYFTELFQVIYTYKLYHLYKVFVQDDLKQARVSKTPIFINSKRYPLIFRYGCIENIYSIPWLVNRNSEYEFLIHFYVVKDERSRPWLAYCLRSLSRLTLNVRLCLDVAEKVGNDFQRVSFIHRADYVLGPRETREPEPVVFLGCPEVLGEARSDSYIGLFLSITDGTTIEQLQSIEGDDTLQSDAVRFEVLSNHMHELRKKAETGGRSCMFISCRSENDSSNASTFVHKGIFECRVPQYWNELEGVAKGDELPETVFCDLSEEALDIIISYIYTGKVFRIPRRLLEEIRRFAERTKFSALLRRVDRFRESNI